MWILKPIDLPDTAPVFISPEEMQNLKRICNLIHNKKQSLYYIESENLLVSFDYYTNYCRGRS
ncbi:TPA: hypothetical protein JBB11_10775 [Legionella pneumophila subsp. pneumophila]|nr:hypothetical protein [Legionella pneumophila]HAT8868601.1 hypothetical protein [Legionella pneumophila subsp. pneumophila]HAT8890101.1 hypothetical protein [Legionella pneumophila subsp. pneumophila]HAT8933786.1 hypothetical protein [Legionella pneumophila subsp. pneumophila]HAU0161388.1 DUF3408 domain-containing protein [Legionella pneumophila]